MDMCVEIWSRGRGRLRRVLMRDRDVECDHMGLPSTGDEDGDLLLNDGRGGDGGRTARRHPDRMRPLSPSEGFGSYAIRLGRLTLQADGWASRAHADGTRPPLEGLFRREPKCPGCKCLRVHFFGVREIKRVERMGRYNQAVGNGLLKEKEGRRDSNPDATPCKSFT